MDVLQGLLSCVFWVKELWTQRVVGVAHGLMGSVFVYFIPSHRIRGLDFLDRDSDPGAS